VETDYDEFLWRRSFGHHAFEQRSWCVVLGESSAGGLVDAGDGRGEIVIGDGALVSSEEVGDAVVLRHFGVACLEGVGM